MTNVILCPLNLLSDPGAKNMSSLRAGVLVTILTILFRTALETLNK